MNNGKKPPDSIETLETLESMLLSELTSGDYDTQTLYEAVVRACRKFDPNFSPVDKSQGQTAKPSTVINISVNQ